MGWQDLRPSEGWYDEWHVWHEPVKDMGNAGAHEPRPQKTEKRPDEGRRIYEEIKRK